MSKVIKHPPRVQAIESIIQVLSEKCSIQLALDNNSCKDPFAKELTYGVIRNLLFLEGILGKLLKKNLKNKLLTVKICCLVGLYQCEFMRTPKYAAINETVNTLSNFNLDNYKSLVNAILRNFLNQRDEIVNELQKSYETKYSVPQWFILELKKTYAKDEVNQILSESCSKPPMWLRINRNKVPFEKYCNILKQNSINYSLLEKIPSAIKLSTPIPIENIPYFEQDFLFVQDAASQFSAYLLDVKENQDVLDCCCAPGGKTTHILELTPKIRNMVAIDVQEDRLEKVKENLSRLKLKATVKVADASKNDFSWSPCSKYQRILLDAPCSATGVIRRHPEIKIFRTLDEINKIVSLQEKILENIWQLLDNEGILLYTTCSILPQENSIQISKFLSKHKDAKLIAITENESNQNPGLQILPGYNGMDGFFYAKLQKV